MRTEKQSATEPQNIQAARDVVEGVDNTLTWVNDTLANIDTFLKALFGNKDGEETVPEPPPSIKLQVVDNQGNKQDVTTETMKYVQGVEILLGVLLPLWLLGQGIWSLLNGFGDLFGMLTSLFQAGDEKAGALLNAIDEALAEEGLDRSALADQNAELVQTLMIPPIAGVTSETMRLADVLDRALPQFPMIACPSGAVDPNSETPPPCSLVSAVQFQTDPNPFNTFGNPVAALANDMTLATDLNNLAGQHQNLASAARSLKDAANKLKEQNYAESLCLSLHAILKSMATYNFQTDENGSDPTLRSLKFFQSAPPVAAVVPPALVEKLTQGEALSEAEQTQMSNAIAALTTKGEQATSETHRWGALPGTLMWAALENDGFTGTLEALLDQIPVKIAQREGVSAGNQTLLQSLIFSLSSPDERVEEIPLILLGVDTRIGNLSPAFKRWLETLIYLKNLTAAQILQLRVYETQISTLSLLYIQDVQAAELDFTTLYVDLLQHRLTFAQLTVLRQLAQSWDSLNQILTIEPLQQHPDAVAFLTELLAARPLQYANIGMFTSIDELLAATLALGGFLGSDLAQLVGAFGAVRRACVILDSTSLTLAEKTARTKVVLTKGDTMLKDVERFPVPGVLGRIAAAL